MQARWYCKEHLGELSDDGALPRQVDEFYKRAKNIIEKARHVALALPPEDTLAIHRSAMWVFEGRGQTAFARIAYWVIVIRELDVRGLLCDEV
ncbi:MAG: hypothetical protein ACYDGM_09670 [Vulcanimicrobiaceae bacterium]